VAAANFYTFDSILAELEKGKGGTKIDLSTDTLSVYLSNATPDRAIHSVKGDLAEITPKNGYAGMVDLVITRSTYNNTRRFVATDVEWTGTATTDANGFGPFRYVNLVSKTSNATDANRSLIGFWAYPSSLTIPNGGIFKVDFSAIDGMMRLRSAI
jgi:hypothetical protein